MSPVWFGCVCEEWYDASPCSELLVQGLWKAVCSRASDRAYLRPGQSARSSPQGRAVEPGVDLPYLFGQPFLVGAIFQNSEIPHWDLRKKSVFSRCVVESRSSPSPPFGAPARTRGECVAPCGYECSSRFQGEDHG